MPLESGHVEVFDAAGHELLHIPVGVAGAYSADVVAPGTFYLSAHSAGYLSEIYSHLACSGSGCEPLDGTPLPLPGPNGVAGIDFTLARPATISGTVTSDSNGAALSASVELHSLEAGFLGYYYTQPGGSWSTGATLMPGTYFALALNGSYQPELYSQTPCPSSACDPAGGTPIVLGLGQVRGGVDFSLPPLGSIHGRVTASDSGAALPYADVLASTTFGFGGTSTTADSAGRYELGGLTTDAYLVRAAAVTHVSELFSNVPCDTPGFCSWTCDSSAATRVSVTLGQASVVNFALTRRGGMSGSVVAAAPGSPPIANAAVTVALIDGCGIDATETAADGSWTLPALMTGDYRVSTSGTPLHLDEAWQGIPCDEGGCNLGDAVPVHPEVITGGVDFALDLGGHDQRASARRRESRSVTGSPCDRDAYGFGQHPCWVH